MPLHATGSSLQHRGLGKKLLQEAEAFAKTEGFDNIVVIAGLGVKEYYQKKFGYQNAGPYLAKKL
jgi:elongator complex protein 3